MSRNPHEDDSESDPQRATPGREGARDERAAAQSAVSRRGVLQAGAAAGLATAGLGASSPATAQSDSAPSYEQAAEELSHPDPSDEAIALYRFLHDVWGEGILSGQQHEPWGVDEMDYVQETTGKLPAVQGADFIHDDKTQTVDQTIEWWNRGGITAIMWHWGVPGLELGDEYEESRDDYIEDAGHDVSRVLQEGTEANDLFWQELDEVAGHLEELRDQGIPVIWRPFHEFEGGWFWWGMEGPEFFVELWETMHDYFVHEHDLDNLVWLLPHTNTPRDSWMPDSSTWDLGGADGYPGGRSSQSGTYDEIQRLHGDRPPIFHECGTPLDPDNMERDGAWWTMWILWHTGHLTDTEDSYLNHVYNHELTVTLDDLPDIVAEYGEPDVACDLPEFRQYVRVDGGDWIETDEVSVQPGSEVEFGPQPDTADWSWSGGDLSADTREVTVSPTETTTYYATADVGCPTTPTLEFTVTVEQTDRCVAAGGQDSAPVDGRTVCDVNGDGLFRDVTGDGSVGQTDVVEFFENQHREAWKQPSMFDFSGNGSVGHGDVVQLFEDVATGGV